jgi:hypothetical protein
MSVSVELQKIKQGIEAREARIMASAKLVVATRNATKGITGDNIVRC